MSLERDPIGTVLLDMEGRSNDDNCLESFLSPRWGLDGIGFAALGRTLLFLVDFGCTLSSSGLVEHNLYIPLSLNLFSADSLPILPILDT